ncbi:AMP-binding protein [Streptomyces sp. ID05-39B]|uniref:AMP-binding protein n=1 Tax=Streptomyces sp. ID05-39B TaxID=3028664 RepID=UPI0029BA0A05|nr:AMP-binding protein [Streptomyces sp. ID05-39B]MDX3525724.1 AMP-binding protein [Streptomyces sp. ID05-39B]
MTARDLWQAFSRTDRDPDALALGDLTRRAAVDRVTELAQRLRAQGVRPGQPVGLQGPNQPEWVLGLLALIAAGACPLLLPADSPPAETRRLLRTAGARRTLVVDPDGTDWAVLTGESEGADRGLAAGETGSEPDSEPPAHAPGTLLLASSGSTGTPKVVARSPRSVLDEGVRYHRAGLARPDDRVLLPLPLSHAYALGWLAGALVAGAHVDPVPPRAVGAVHTRLRERATVLVTVPGLARVLARRRALADDAPFPALRRVMAGAGYVDAELDALWTAALGVGVSRNFGSSETGAVLWGEPGLPSGAVGHPMPGVRVDLLDPEGRPLPCSGAAQGELAVVLEDGSTHRLHDLADRDEHGVHRILGRARLGVVRRGARWVSTLEVESVLRTAPGVADLSVTATGPDDSDDQGLTVEYVPADPELAAPRRLQAYARAELAAYKVPDSFQPRYRLRRSAVGKVQAAPVYRLAAARPDTPAEQVLAAALAELGLPPLLAGGAAAADLARTAGLRADVLSPVLDTACALGLLATDSDFADPPDAGVHPPDVVLAGRALAARVRGDAVDEGPRPPAAPAGPPPPDAGLRAAVAGLLAEAAVDGTPLEIGDGGVPQSADAQYGACVVVGGVHGPAARLGSLAALLRPQGLLVVADTFVSDPLALTDETSRTTVVRWLVDGHLHWWTAQELRAGLEAVGLRVEEIRAAEQAPYTILTARKTS